MESPQLSVVIAAHNAAAVIGKCLAALQAQPGREMAEVIVVDSSTDGTAELVRECFPDVRLLHFSKPVTIPDLRGAGITEAQGEIIAILDPYCEVADGWLTELLRLHSERPEPVIGGAVELDNPTQPNLVSWATYFCEYEAFMSPLEAGPATELTGNNIAYKRWALEGEGLQRGGFWKTFVNRQLLAQGYRLWLAPSLLVRLHKPVSFVEFFGSRYHHGRCFAAMRVAAAPRYERWFRAATAPLLPYLSLWRQLRRLWPKRRHRTRFALTIPLLFLFHSSWAWGELRGYLRGPGRSCAQLFY